jgi:signal transduction histidine kinase
MQQQKNFTFITVVFWVLFLYIVAALVWWFIALNRQSTEMADFKIEQLSTSDPNYDALKKEALDFRQRKKTQYIGEGSIFFLLIIIGAVFVYRATRKQIQLARQQQNFMMAVTHELKTPIAIAKLNLETLQKRKLDEDKRQRLLQTAIVETDRLNDLANNILLASRMAVGEVVKFSTEVDLQKQVADIVRQYEVRYPGRAIIFNNEGTFLLQGDELLLRILVSNLVDNAVKYTPENAPVTILLTSEKSVLRLEVKDNGPGIPEEEKKKVFTKFYRMGNEETRNSKGTGLGLYLCKKIAEAHKGKLMITDNSPTGSVFSIKFPING